MVTALLVGALALPALAGPAGHPAPNMNVHAPGMTAVGAAGAAASASTGGRFAATVTARPPQAGDANLIGRAHGPNGNNSFGNNNAARLDLRLPTPNRFDAARRESDSLFGHSGTANVEDERFRDLGAAYAQAARNTGMPALVRRVRHEGLPVARLWENNSAMVSLGLNGRGKPGLWLVQKIH